MPISLVSQEICVLILCTKARMHMTMRAPAGRVCTGAY
jgi:hypothetical protein